MKSTNGNDKNSADRCNQLLYSAVNYYIDFTFLFLPLLCRPTLSWDKDEFYGQFECPLFYQVLKLQVWQNFVGLIVWGISSIESLFVSFLFTNIGDKTPKNLQITSLFQIVMAITLTRSRLTTSTNEDVCRQYHAKHFINCKFLSVYYGFSYALFHSS